jgi:hypothetical protein
VNLQNPMPLTTGSIRRTHPVVILRMGIESDFVARDFLVRKDADQMSGDAAAKFPAGLRSQFERICIEVCSSDLRAFSKILLTFGEGLFDIAAQLAFQRIISHRVRAAEIGLPILEYWTKVEKDNVVFPDDQVWRIFIITALGCWDRNAQSACASSAQSHARVPPAHRYLH